MADFQEIAAQALVLLAVPGPTNTLLATAAATSGLRRALPMIAAELLGYSIAIGALMMLVTYFGPSHASANIALRLMCGAYLARTSWKLWTSVTRSDGRLVTFSQIFLATLSNPKAAVFAFVILPTPNYDVGMVAQEYGPLLLSLISLAGFGWVLIGSVVHRNASPNTALWVRRASATTVAVFSMFILLGAAQDI